MAKTKTTAERRNGEGKTPAERHAAYFLSLSLENVRCFGPRQTLDLSDGNGKPARWTIILGLNGTGKTTVLQILAGLELIPQPLPSNQGEHWGPRLFSWLLPRILFLRNSTNINGPHVGEPILDQPGLRRGTSAAGDFTSKIAVCQGLEVCTEESKLVRCKITSSSVSIKTEPEPTETTEQDPSETPEYMLWCCAYGAGRRLSNTINIGNSDSDDSAASLFSDSTNLRNAEEWLIQLDYSAKASTDKVRQQERLEKVKQMLLEILPEVDDIRLVAGTGPNPKARAEFKTPYGWVPLRQLGYGYQTLIAWMVDFASRLVERYPDSPNPLAEPAVVLVDEIDLHLHPTWQRKLMDVLTERFPNTQFIATAHSPLVAQAAAHANLAVLRREGDHVVIDNDVEKYIRNWSIDQILTSDLFGLETARPPQIEKLLLERKDLLSKANLTSTDQRRIKEIENEVGELPFGETAQEAKEREEIRKTLELLKERRLAQ